jgi:hypothetical protein
MPSVIAAVFAHRTIDLHFEPFEGALEQWGETLNAFPDREIFQTPAWMRFLAESQGATPVIATLKRGKETLGYFAGLSVRKFGFKILGSPFIGWTTERMGLRLMPGVSRRPALKALLDYAFHDLGCAHLEFADANYVRDDVVGLGFQTLVSQGSAIDLTLGEDEIYHNFRPKSCRYSIRKAVKEGVVIEEATDDAFADDYFEQLRDVFAKQSLVPTYHKDRVQCLMRHLMPTGNLLLLRAREPGGRCIATGIFPGMHDRAYFWGGASWRSDQHFCPNELIQWHAIRYWKARGAKIYDFCGGGDYKRKYGGQEMKRLLFRKSKHHYIAWARSMAACGFRLYQKYTGRNQNKTDADERE